MKHTPQTILVLDVLRSIGHATNAQLLRAAQSEMPGLSATTVHRITTRLINDKRIGVVRVSSDGAMVLDATPEPHHHFVCLCCENICDIAIPGGLITSLRDQVCYEVEMEALVVSGRCKKCKGE